MPTRYVRYTANAIITIYCLIVVAVRLSAVSSGYHLLWGGVALIVILLDLYYLTKSALNEPKSADTSMVGFLLGVGGTLGFAVTAFVITYPAADMPLLRQTGSILALIPYPFIIWSLLCLRGCLTVIPEAHSVVAHGIYKYSRHPLYVCYIVWAFANIMMFPSLPMVGVSLAHIAVLLMRLKREERLLLATFPEYHDYYRRTGIIGQHRLRFLLGE